ncbi:MAG: arabinogalactan endo-1,4-beta-galactosidase [Muribaculaceae bacterium]|nr:arabinogalactan endo-1,4-beta-galactosidase [Muribaculaceae bacterium]
MKIKSIFLSAVAAIGLTALQGCTQDSPITNPPVDKSPVEFERGAFAKGADVSWLTQFEAQGYKWQNADGQQKELMTLLRDDCGVNAIRLRVWVNPENDAVVEGWCNTDDFMVKARRANALGLRLMVDFHFSDTWADPGKQGIPAAWAQLDLDGVLEAMSDHVSAVLGALQREGIEPEWVQIGNETRTGMMWPIGSIDNDDNFTRMVNAGHDAVKAVFPDALVIVHCDCGNEQWLYDRLFGKLKNEGARYDMIGMSLYPEDHNWEKLVDDCVANISHCSRTYGKPVMVCEIGMQYDQEQIADKMMRRLYQAGKEADLKGIFWWEPETPVGSNGYGKGCVDSNGVPTKALSVFTDEE